MPHPLFKWAKPTMPNVNIVQQTRDKYVLSWIMYIWHETLIFCHIFCMAAKAMRDPFYKIDWLTDSIKTNSFSLLHHFWAKWHFFHSEAASFIMANVFFYILFFCHLIWKFVCHLDLDLSKRRDKHCQRFKWHFFLHQLFLSSHFHLPFDVK